LLPVVSACLPESYAHRRPFGFCRSGKDRLRLRFAGTSFPGQKGRRRIVTIVDSIGYVIDALLPPTFPNGNVPGPWTLLDYFSSLDFRFLSLGDR
jgi:hypothetical protein